MVTETRTELGSCPKKFDTLRNLERLCIGNACQCWAEDIKDCGLKARKSINVSLAR